MSAVWPQWEDASVGLEEEANSKTKMADSTGESAILIAGSPGRTRTSDRVVNSHLLYQLSYRGKSCCSDFGLFLVC